MNNALIGEYIPAENWPAYSRVRFAKYGPLVDGNTEEEEEQDGGSAEVQSD